jgi:hypothetical protein
MQQLVSNSRKNVARLFENILLFAADEDDDAFEYDYKLKRLPDLARRVTVYHNSGDITSHNYYLALPKYDMLSIFCNFPKAIRDSSSLTVCDESVKTGF